MRIKSVFVIGDSISIGYGPHLKAMLEGRLGYDRIRKADESSDDLDGPIGENGGDSTTALTCTSWQCDRVFDIHPVLGYNG